MACTALCKRGGVPKRYLPFVALGHGLLAGLVIWAIVAFPSLRPLAESLVIGLLAGLSAAGAYDVWHQSRKNLPPH